mmetsp:Transcript_3094/g.6702  ORF Transcript_3094/g.6702 Transcript_3094/m.6702 type:complete len:109 (-) Transcript_3094:327-653(-)
MRVTGHASPRRTRAEADVPAAALNCSALISAMIDSVKAGGSELVRVAGRESAGFERKPRTRVSPENDEGVVDESSSKVGGSRGRMVGIGDTGELKREVIVARLDVVWR